MELLNLVFGTLGDLTWSQECARAVLIMAYGLLLVRIAGRRLFGKWSALDIIVSVMIGSNLSRALTGSAALWATLAATTLLLGLHWALAKAASRWAPVSWAVEGAPVTLVVAGELARDEMRRHSFSDTDLAEALRQSGLRDVDQVQSVTLEPSGKISVMKK